MPQQEDLEQFIYGKFVGPDSGYRIIAHSSNLEDEKALQEIAEQECRFLQQHSNDNLWGVGISRNNTQTLPEQEIILIQESIAQYSDESLAISGTRPFYQRFYIFVPEATALKLNKSIFWWLAKFSLNKVPIFKALNQPNDSVYSWLFGQDYFSLIDERIKNVNPETIITDVWQKLSPNERNLWLQALDAIMSGKKLLIAIAENKDAKSKFLLKLDNLLLLFIPLAWRNKLSIAMGKDIDLEVCKWANIVVSFQEKPSYLPFDWVGLDLASKIITPNQSIESEYVKDLIEPLKDDYESLITLCKKIAENENSNVGLNLKTTNNHKKFSEFGGVAVQDDFGGLLQGKPLDFSHPSIDFIANYPQDDVYKIQLFSKYIKPLKSELEIFLGNADKEQDLMVLKILWDAVKQNLDTSADIAILCLGKMFALLTEDEFFKRLQELEAAHVMKLISNGLLKELKKIVNKEDNLELIKKELQPICLQHIKENINNYQYEKLKNLASSHLQEIFASEVEEFELWDSFLAQRIDKKNFMNLLDEKLIPVIPKIDLPTFKNSYLIKYLNFSFPLAFLGLQDVFSNRNLSKLCQVSSGLKMNNTTTNKLYITFLESQSQSYENSHYLLIDAIKRSIDPKTTAFEIQDFLDVYEWFKNNKPDFSEILSQLNETNQFWSTWESVSTFLYSDNDTQNRVNFLDNTVAQKYPAEVLKSWFDLFTSEPNNLKIEESFLNGKSWHNLTEETLENMYIYLTTDFPDYVSNLIKWAYEKSRFNLINGKLTEYAIEIWEDQNKIDEQTWQILIKLEEKLCNKKRFRMRIADLLCEQNLPANYVENKVQNTVEEIPEKSESQHKIKVEHFKENVKVSSVKKSVAEVSNKNLNKGKVNHSRDFPIYNEKEQEMQKSLTDIARQKVNLFKDYPEKIESFLQLCENFQVNILPVLVEVGLKNCPVGFCLNYLRRSNIDKSSTEYLRCLEQLSQAQNNTIEQQQIIDFMSSEITNIIKDSNIPDLEKQRINLAVNAIVSKTRPESK